MRLEGHGVLGHRFHRPMAEQGQGGDGCAICVGPRKLHLHPAIAGVAHIADGNVLAVFGWIIDKGEGAGAVDRAAEHVTVVHNRRPIGAVFAFLQFEGEGDCRRQRVAARPERDNVFHTFIALPVNRRADSRRRGHRRIKGLDNAQV
eukprot:s1_g1536.t1